MDDKAISVEIKNEARREISAVIATLRVVDLDGDYTLPGAFAKGGTRDVLISRWGHDVMLQNAAPVGKGRVDERGDEVVFEGAYFDTAEGHAAFATVKGVGESNGPTDSRSWNPSRRRSRAAPCGC